MARPRGPLTRCGGTMTEAQYHSHIKNILRRASFKWPPYSQCLKNAWVRRGFYRCACCDVVVPVTVKDEEKRKRIKNIIVDHIEPVVPLTGWESWDDTVENMYCELDNLQALCRTCHNKKSLEETAQRTEHRSK